MKTTIFLLGIILFFGCTSKPIYYASVKYLNGKTDTICISCYGGSIDTNDYPKDKNIFVRTIGVNQRGGVRKYQDISLAYNRNITFGYFVSIREAKLLGFFEKYPETSKRYHH